MNYTEKYHLPQWEKTDRVMMEDFNRMCADMEAGLEKTARDAAADTAAAKQENAAAAARAQGTADTAVSLANTAQRTAGNAYCPGKYPYKVGTYTGTGEDGVERHVNVGFAPRFVMVTARISSSDNVQAMGSEGITQHPITLTSTGFYALQYRGWPQVNVSGVTYVYIAFP